MLAQRAAKRSRTDDLERYMSIPNDPCRMHPIGVGILESSWSFVPGSRKNGEGYSAYSCVWLLGGKDV